MENINIEIIKNYEISNKQILTCYEQLTRSYFCQHTDFVNFYYYLKQLQYEFYTILTSKKTNTTGEIRPFKITSYNDTIEEQYFIFDKNPDNLQIDLKINKKIETLSYLEFVKKYFNLDSSNVYRSFRILEKFIDYEIKTTERLIIRIPRLKQKYGDYTFSKLRLLLPFSEDEISNLITCKGLNPKMTVLEIETLLKAPKEFKEKKPTLDYDYTHTPLYTLEDFDCFKPNETKFYLHQTYVQYHEEKKEKQILSEMVNILSKQLISEDKGQQKIITETRNKAKIIISNREKKI